MTNEFILAQELQSQSSKDITHGEISAEYSRVLRKAGAEGIVMLKNDGTLPIKADSVISVFGRCQHDYFYAGNGSGGDVITPYKVNLIQGLENNPKLSFNKELADRYAAWSKDNVPEKGGWGTWPTHYKEMPLTGEEIKQAREKSDTALVIIGRSAGEDRDSYLQEGSFYLTKEEENMLDNICECFDKIVLVINSGNVIDFSWYKKYEDKISSLLYVWQGGMESGNSVCDVLSGDENPSGKLTAAIAEKYEDYPASNDFGGKDYNNYTEDIYVGYRYFETFAREAVLFPFGFGLSYTDFEIKTGEVKEMDGNVTVAVSVKNIGKVSGSEVVQVYYEPPQGVLGKPLRQLAAFNKTSELAPGAVESFDIQFPLYFMASYDDAGATGYKSAYVLEPGEYAVYAGSCVRSAEKAGVVKADKLTVCDQLEEAAAVPLKNKFKRLVAKSNANGSVSKAFEDVPTRTVSLKERISANMPTEIKSAYSKPFKLTDVIENKISLENFVAGLTIEELEGLTRGDYVMNSSLGTPGNAGVFGGVTESLREKGVIPISTSDGPSGVRLKFECAQLPCGLALASTWNTRLLTELATLQGEEMSAKGSHVLLAPGMNIIRSPLCGRNFEYYSEDPVLSGKIASAMVNGLQKHGKSACPKHYVCNNQEQHRHINDSRVSERALREIYLKGFEICVKDSAPRHIMTSYNKINGVWGHYHYELCETVLRGEWGFDGNILTDWWMRPSVDPDFPDVFNDGYRVRAGVDVLMPGSTAHYTTEGDGSLIESFNKPNGVTLAEIQKAAINVLRFVIYVIKTDS